MATATAAAVLALLTACEPRPDSQSEAYLRSVIRTEAPLEHAWRRFDAAVRRGDWEAARLHARSAADAASAARDALEREPVAQELSTARREELVFLNHAFLGFRDFGARGAGEDGLAPLRSILRRGRAHQALGRETLR